MLTRKNGETDKQFCKRLQAALENVTENNRSLRKFLNGDNLINPRTGKSYKSEAQEMFYTLAFAADFLMNGNEDVTTLKDILRGQFQSLGFNDAEIDTREIIKDNAYTGE